MPAYPARALPPENHPVAALRLRLVSAELELRERRAESRRSLAQLLALLGYPEGWAVELEKRTFSHGKVWTAREPA